MTVRSAGPSPARYLVHDGKDMVMMLGLALGCPEVLGHESGIG
jgi:hypothetical protein